MVTYLYYDAADDEQPRLTFCWQTWLVWLLVVAGYAAWHYEMLATAATRPIDGLGFGIHVTVVGLIALVGKTWLDIRNAQYGCDRHPTGTLRIVAAGDLERLDSRAVAASSDPTRLLVGTCETPQVAAPRPLGSSFAAVRT